jgi:hypothetical protein
VRDGHDTAGLMTRIGDVLPEVEVNEMLTPLVWSPNTGATALVWREGEEADADRTDQVFAPRPSVRVRSTHWRLTPCEN